MTADGAKGGRPRVAEVAREPVSRLGVGAAGGVGADNADTADSTDLLAEPMRRALAATTPIAAEIIAGQRGSEAVLADAITTALSTARERVFDRREPRRA